MTKRSVLITGCSEGGLGAHLAVAFQMHGLRVFATARNPSKMTALSAMGIETLTLDVLSDTSIQECVQAVAKLTSGSLDVLVNNAGGAFTMPFTDVNLAKAKELFDLNVWSYLAVTQAFIPLLLNARGMIVNNTSIASIMPFPYSSVYHASKAAAAMFSEHQRLELAPFGIKVIELKTGTVHSRINTNAAAAGGVMLPIGSMYTPVKADVKKIMRGDQFTDWQDPSNWANAVVGDLLKKSPPTQIWRGGTTWLVWFGSFINHAWLDGVSAKWSGLDKLEKHLKAKKD